MDAETGPAPFAHDSGSSSPRQPGSRAGLTVEQVLEAARELVTRDEAAPLTMRLLAKHLGVAPNTLYSYYPDKAALMDAVLDSLLGDIEPPDPADTDWREGLMSIMDASRRMLLEHTDLFPLLFSRPMVGPNATRLGEATLHFLAQGGVHGPQAVAALRALLTFTFGWVVLETPRRAESDMASREAASQTAFTGQREYPMMAEQSERLAKGPPDEAFKTSLLWLISGILQDRDTLTDTKGDSDR